jgi:hypothetical protein
LSLCELYPNVRLPKVVCDLAISAEQYAKILAGEKIVREGFYSKEKKRHFSAALVFNQEKQKIDFDFAAADRIPPQTLEIRCPKTDQPVLATEKWFTFPGWPDVRCWKLIAKRTMKPEDFIQAFQNGRAELITGFQSKEGKAFDARLVYDAKAKNFSFAFEEKPPGQLVSLQASNTDPTVPSQRPTTTFQTGSKRMQKALVAMKLCRRKGFVIIDAVRYLRRSMASSRRLPLSLL